jgi:predicted dehydrogenase
MVAQVLRFWPEYVKIKELYDSGVLGDIIHIYAGRLGQMPSWGDWYKDPDKSGETLMNLTLHDIDFLHYMLGKPDSVYSAGVRDSHNNYNDCMNIFKFQKNINAVVDGSLSMIPGYPFTMRMRVGGTKAAAEFEYIAGENIGPEATTSLKLFEEGKPAQKVECESYNAYGMEVEYFAQCILSGAETEVVTEESILTVLASVLAAKQSLYDGKVQAL